MAKRVGMAGLARVIVCLILAMRVSDAMAANPSYVCNPAKDCREERFVSMSRGDLVGGHASFTAMTDGDRPFAVVPNRTYASVTSFVISYKFVLFSISVASERAPDEDYRQAVKAVQSIK
jgi:hypothetical protein